MPYRIAFEPDAAEQLGEFSARERATVLDQVEAQLTHQAEIETRNRKRFRANPLAPWELRIGGLRVFYDVDKERSHVRIVAIGRKIQNRLIIGREEVDL